MSTGPAIEIVGLEKRYGDKVVLHGVDLDVHRGEVLCLLGPNGAGKTTTVEILEGFRTADAGSVQVLGFDPARQSQALRERIGVVLQECGFPKHLRVDEMVDAWRGYYPQPRPLGELLEVVELRGQERTPVRHLSGGQRRRLDFALALAGDPELVFLDEPTTGFDPEARRRCWAAIKNLQELGKTVLLTTHYLDEAERLADRVALLDAGAVERVGSPRELARQAGAPTRIFFALPSGAHRSDVPLPDDLPVTVDQARVRCTVDDPGRALRQLLQWADDHHLGELADLEVLPPTLEDVYLHLLPTEESEPT